MKKLLLVITLPVILWGCKKDGIVLNLNNGTVIMQVQGGASQTFTMNEMQSALVFPNADTPFCHSCQFPDSNSGYYLLIANYNSVGNGSNNQHFMIGLGLGGDYNSTWIDTPLSSFFYDFLKTDSLGYADTSFAPYILGAELKYTDTNGTIWDTKNGHNSRYGFKITSCSSLITESPNPPAVISYALIGGTFTGNIYNVSGSSQTLTGSFSNVAVQISH